MRGEKEKREKRERERMDGFISTEYIGLSPIYKRPIDNKKKS